VKPSVSPSKKAVSAPKKDVSPAKGKRGQPVKVDPPAADKKPETKTDTKIDTKDVKSDPKLKKTESKEQLVKVITKGGAAVDSLVPNSASYRVLVDGGKVYSATLNQSNLDANNNKFYIIQVLVQ
jgi:poly [ADP-ribose] polymerase